MAEELDVVSLGAAFGAVFAVYMLMAGLAASFLGWGTEIVNLMSGLYVGYAATPVGSVIGAVWGFIDGFILGAILAFVYNYSLERR